MLELTHLWLNELYWHFPNEGRDKKLYTHTPLKYDMDFYNIVNKFYNMKHFYSVVKLYILPFQIFKFGWLRSKEIYGNIWSQKSLILIVMVPCYHILFHPILIIPLHAWFLFIFIYNIFLSLCNYWVSGTQIACIIIEIISILVNRNPISRHKSQKQSRIIICNGIYFKCVHCQKYFTNGLIWETPGKYLTDSPANIAALLIIWSFKSMESIRQARNVCLLQLHC